MPVWKLKFCDHGIWMPTKSCLWWNFGGLITGGNSRKRELFFGKLYVNLYVNRFITVFCLQLPHWIWFSFISVKQLFVEFSPCFWNLWLIACDVFSSKPLIALPWSSLLLLNPSVFFQLLWPLLGKIAIWQKILHLSLLLFTGFQITGNPAAEKSHLEIGQFRLFDVQWWLH